MSILSGIGTTNNALTGLANSLGIDGWQLVNGKYNGCTFCHFTSIPLLENNPLYASANNLVSSVNQTFGKNILKQKDPNGFGNLFDTTIGLLQMTSEYKPQIVIKPLPYGVKVNTEDLGTAGYEFKFTIIVVGTDYKKALDNIERAIKSPPSGDTYLQLVHPEYGIINGITRCTAFRRISTINIWRGATAELVFRSEESNITGNATTDWLQSITNSILSVLSAISAISATLLELNTMLTSTKGLLGVGNNYTAPVTWTQIKNISAQTKTVQNQLLQGTNYIYKNSNTGATNITLNNTKLDTDYIPSALNFPIPYNELQGALILNNYFNTCEKLKNTILSYGYGGESNNLINTINQSIASLYNVANLCSQKPSTYSYIVPYTMSIHEVLAINNMNFDIALDVLKANPQIKSANYIPSGTTVTL
jgi:prophage DNA circulation protein